MTPAAVGKHLVAWGIGLDGPQPLAWGECFKEFACGMGGLSHNLSYLPQGAGGVADCSKSPVDMLQSASSGGSTPDDVHLPLEVLGDDGAQDAGGLHSVDCVTPTRNEPTEGAVLCNLQKTGRWLDVRLFAQKEEKRVFMGSHSRRSFDRTDQGSLSHTGHSQLNRSGIR